MTLQALVSANDEIIHYSKQCVFGNFEGEDKWMFYSNTREGLPVPELYAMDNNFHVVDFDSADLPEDYTWGKYLLPQSGTFVPNPNYQPPQDPVEDRLDRIEEAMAELAEMMFGGEL